MGRKKRNAGESQCESCGQLNDIGARYCGQCGNALGGKFAGRERPRSRKGEPSYWFFVAIIALIFFGGLVAKTIFYPSPKTKETGIQYRTPVVSDESLEKQVQLVASNFRCACGGCGELPLIECNCDMPRGALEEKSFIREKLMTGLTIDQVIQLVEAKYGLKTAG